MKISTNTVTSNLIWRLLERFSSQGVTLVVSVILARLLDPSSYGTISLITVFTAILQVFIDSGLGTALIQKKDADDLDFSTVFYFNMAMCLGLYALMFFGAPLIAAFYEMPELTPLVRVPSLTLVISGVQGIQQSYVSKTMQFKRFFYSTIGSTVFSAVAGIAMAYAGFGAWALVAQSIISNLASTVILWVTVKWRPKWMFSWRRLKGLFSYGWKLLVASLINNIYSKVRQLIIGKYYSSEDLAFYNKGEQYPHLLVNNINSSIDSVLLPTMASEQDHKDRIKAMTRRAIRISSYIMWPMMLGLAAVAEPFVRLLLTEKWLPCVFFLRIMCIVYGFQPLQTANLNAIKAMGRSDVFLKLDIIKKAVGLTAMFSTIFISVEVMACSYIITTTLSAFINAYPNKKFIDYSFREQIVDILPSLSLALGMAVICYSISLLGLGDFITLILQIIVGVVVYVGGSILFKLESFSYVLTLVKNHICKKK